jgi:hypothetical protein
MDIRVSHPQFAKQELVVRTGGLLRSAKLLLTGTVLKPVKGVYKIKNDAGNEVDMKLGISWIDAVPPLTIDGVKFRLARPFSWYEWVWIGLPAVLIPIGGFLGALIGIYACYSSSRVVRGSGSAVMRYGISGLISIFAGVSFLVMSSLVHTLADAVR